MKIANSFPFSAQQVLFVGFKLPIVALWLKMEIFGGKVSNLIRTFSSLTFYVLLT